MRRQTLTIRLQRRSAGVGSGSGLSATEAVATEGVAIEGVASDDVTPEDAATASVEPLVGGALTTISSSLDPHGYGIRTVSVITRACTRAKSLHEHVRMRVLQNIYLRTFVPACMRMCINLPIYAGPLLLRMLCRMLCLVMGTPRLS